MEDSLDDEKKRLEIQKLRIENKKEFSWAHRIHKIYITFAPATIALISVMLTAQILVSANVFDVSGKRIQNQQDSLSFNKTTFEKYKNKIRDSTNILNLRIDSLTDVEKDLKRQIIVVQDEKEKKYAELTGKQKLAVDLNAVRKDSAILKVENEKLHTQVVVFSTGYFELKSASNAFCLDFERLTKDNPSIDYRGIYVDFIKLKGLANK